MFSSNDLREMKLSVFTAVLVAFVLCVGGGAWKFIAVVVENPGEAVARARECLHLIIAYSEAIDSVFQRRELLPDANRVGVCLLSLVVVLFRFVWPGFLLARSLMLLCMLALFLAWPSLGLVVVAGFSIRDVLAWLRTPVGTKEGQKTSAGE
jgi:hypothetical protein